MLQTSTGTEKLIKCASNCAIRVTWASNAARNLLSPLKTPKVKEILEFFGIQSFE
jgi:hypothetical protein